MSRTSVRKKRNWMYGRSNGSSFVFNPKLENSLKKRFFYWKFSSTYITDFNVMLKALAILFYTVLYLLIYANVFIIFYDR